MTAESQKLPLVVDPLIAEAKQRARRRWLITALAVALLAGGTFATFRLRSSGPTPLSGPQGALASMVATALSQKSVHWTQSGGEDMQGSYQLSTDVTADSGVEHLILFPAAKAELRFVNGVVYVRGNPMGLRWLLSLTDAQVSRYAGEWIAMPKSAPFTMTWDRLTLPSLVHDVTSPDLGWSRPMTPKVIRGTSHGTRTLVFQEGDPRRGSGLSLSARASGDRLPIAAFVSFGPGTWFSGRFSDWNEAVHVIAPTRAVPLATVRRS